MEEHLRSLTTELRNEDTMNIDSVNTMEIISAINKEDLKVAAAVQEVLPEIKTVVEWALESLKKVGDSYTSVQERVEDSVCWMPWNVHRHSAHHLIGCLA